MNKRYNSKFDNYIISQMTYWIVSCIQSAFCLPRGPVQLKQLINDQMHDSMCLFTINVHGNVHCFAF